MARTTETDYTPRITFNWGFHDGADDAMRKKARRTNAVDPHYKAGYDAGYWDAQHSGARPASSDAAWREYENAKRTARGRPPKAERKQRIVGPTRRGKKRGDYAPWLNTSVYKGMRFIVTDNKKRVHGVFPTEQSALEFAHSMANLYNRVYHVDELDA